jgi:guanylate kinase
MKYFIFISLFLTCQVFALSYKEAKSDLYPFMDIHEITQKLNEDNFLEMDQSKKGNIFNNSFDQIYFNTVNSNKLAILKFDIQLDTSQKILKISDTEFVCHGQTSRDRYFALYIKGQKRNEFEKICHRINQKSSFSFRKYLIQNLMSEAQADESCQAKNSNLNHIASVSTEITQNVLMQRIGTCAVDAVRSALKAYKGAVDGAISILKNPLELWHQISQQAIALKDFVMNLKSEVMGLYENLKTMDTEMILAVGCQLAGELLASASLSALGGAGILKLTQKLVQIFNRLKNSKTLLSRLSVLSKSGKSETAREVLSCVIK